MIITTTAREEDRCEHGVAAETESSSDKDDELRQLGERIADLAARINAAEGRMMALLADFDRRGGWKDEFSSCAEWLAWRTGIKIGPARERVRAARALENLPRALAAGFGEDSENGPDESGTRAERYQVVVHTEAATLAEQGEPGRSDLDGVRVSSETSRRMACDAATVEMVHGMAEMMHDQAETMPAAVANGPVLSVDRRTRTILRTIGVQQGTITSRKSV